MKKLRCPYCKHLIDGAPQPQCPSCGKTMMLPDSILQPDSRKDKKRIKETIARDAERQKKLMGVGEIGTGGKRKIMILAILVLSCAGALLVNRAHPVQPAGKARQTPEQKAEHNLGILKIALERFQEDFDRYPTTKEGLRALMFDPEPWTTNWFKAYVDFVYPDPWDMDYVYSSSNGTFVLFSLGPDQKPATDDDIYPPSVKDLGRQWGRKYWAEQAKAAATNAPAPEPE